MSQRSKYRKVVELRPVEHMYDINQAPMNQPDAAASWPSMNVMLGDQLSIVPRPGYGIDRVLAADEQVQGITWFKKRDASEFTIYLTKNDMLVKKTGTGETFSYFTPQVTAGTVTTQDHSSDVTGNTTVWATPSGAVAAGDKFIVSDDHIPAVEPDSNWRTIESVGGDTALTLTENYSTTHMTGSDYKIRHLYHVPSGERWAHCVASNMFIFTCGAEPVQYWDGTSTLAQPLDITGNNAQKARYCIAYAERLLLADVYINGVREPWSLQWSKQADPTIWLDSTAGNKSFVETEGFITGLGLVGSDLVVYKDRSMIFGSMTGVAATPFTFLMERRGVGCWAPYSLVHAMSTNFFLGSDDFYVVNGDHPESIGQKVRGKFFDMVPIGEREKVFGWWSRNCHMVIWVANTTSYGQVFFGYDYINMEWMTWKYHMDVTGVGEEA